MRKKIVAGNWKMNLDLSEGLGFAKTIDHHFREKQTGKTGIILCTPFIHLAGVAEILKGGPVELGAQNCASEPSGAFTGEVSAAMIKSTGAQYVIIGHSERRQYFHETDETVNRKMISAFRHNLTPIVCVGETLDERERNVTFKIIEKQMKAGVKDLTEQEAKSLVIAYEPVWAIGTGKTATPAQAQEVHAYIRKLYSEMYGKKAGDEVGILYGGSVKPENCKELMTQPDIDGGLVGGASLDADSFTRIVKYDS